MKFKTMSLAFNYCEGSGIELGAAAHNPFGLADCLNIAPSDGVSGMYPEDVKDYWFYAEHQRELTGSEVAKVDRIGDFQQIGLEDNSTDYIISSHVIEHSPNVLAAFIESDRVLRAGGVFFCIFPKRNAEPSDADRPLTTLEQMIQAHREGFTVESLSPWRAHLQVLSTHTMLQAVNYLNQQKLGSWLIECVEETDSKVGNGHTLVLRKVEGIAEAKWLDETVFAEVFNQLVSDSKFEDALFMIKVWLSFNFFDAEKLFLTALLCQRLDMPHEGLEFLIQALILDPLNERYLTDYQTLTGKPFQNPVV